MPWIASAQSIPIFCLGFIGRKRSERPSEPDDLPDHVHFGAVHFVPGRIGGIIAGDCDLPRSRFHSDAFDGQNVVCAQDIDAIAQPGAMLRCIDEDLVTVAQGIGMAARPQGGSRALGQLLQVAAMQVSAEPQYGAAPLR